MASVPKTTAVAAPSPAQSARGAGPVARVASASDSMVEALDSGANISFDASASEYNDQQGHTNLNREGSGRRRLADPGVDRLFTSDSQSFAAIFEAGDTGKAQERTNERHQARLQGTPVSKIITTYETNALVITGEQPVRGTSFSFNL
jgi:hypothetical protein